MARDDVHPRPVCIGLLGHADTRITSRHYAQLVDENLRSAVAKLPAFGQEPEQEFRSIS